MEHQKKILTRFASLVLLLLCVVTVATAQTPQQIAQKAFRSTVLLMYGRCQRSTTIIG